MIEAAPRNLRSYIRDVPDFPKPGIVFKDITPLLRDPGALSLAMELMAQPFRGLHVDVVAGAESRGFIFAMALAAKLSAGFIPVRKPGRLPCPTRSEAYDLEYGSGALEIHEDALKPGDRVLLVDDLLATGGTMAACCRLVESLEAEVVGAAFLIELSFLDGRRMLPDRMVHSIVVY
jgi:adenine phosphoribosyltransferase